MLEQPDGSIILLGTYPEKPIRRLSLRHLWSDGTEDTAWRSLEGMPDSPSFTGRVNSIANDTSGRVLVAGYFGGGANDGRFLVRLLPDGSRDPEFAAAWQLGQPPVNYIDAHVGTRVALQYDGSIILAGPFGSIRPGASYGGLMHRTENGGPDDLFLPNSGFDTGRLGNPTYGPGVSLLDIDSQGRIVAAGTFTHFGTNLVPGWVRLLRDGTWDSGFAPTVNGSNFIQLQTVGTGFLLTLKTNHDLQLFSDQGQFITNVASGCSTFAVRKDGSVLVGFSNSVVRMVSPIPALAVAGFKSGIQWVSEAAAQVKIPVVRFGPNTNAASVSFHIYSGTAVSGVDFQETNGTAYFSPGASETVINLPLTAQNSVPNDDKTIQVDLIRGTGISIAPSRSSSIVNLRDDDVGLNVDIYGFNQLTTSPNIPNPNPRLVQPVIDQGEYFATLLDRHRDECVDFEWNFTGPLPGLYDNFSMIWTGDVVAPTAGNYQFATIADDGFRVWLDGVLILNLWGLQSAVLNHSAPIFMDAQTTHRIVFDYFEYNFNATARLLWMPPGSNTITIIPRQYLRPGLPEYLPPRLSTATNSLTYATEAGRPVEFELSTNGITWTSVRQMVSRTNGVDGPYTISPSVVEGYLGRVRSIDGIAVTNAYPPIIRANGNAGGSIPTIALGSTNAVVLSVRSMTNVGQAIVWLRDGIPMASGSSMVITGRDPMIGTNYQAMVSYPFAQVVSDVRQVLVSNPLPPSFQAIPLPAGDSLRLHADVSPGIRVRVYGSPDLVHWTIEAESEGSIDFTVKIGATPTRFFRAAAE